MCYQDATKFMKGLNNKDANEQNNQAQNDQAAKQDAANADQKVEQKQPAAETTAPAPTRTEKGLYSGNFQTPTATPTHHPTSQPNVLGKIPLIGGLLGGTGGPL